MSQYISKETFKKLENGYLKLIKERKKVAEHLKKSASFGDLSENAEYQQAREEKERLEKKILEAKQRLRSVKIKEKTNSNGVVCFYSKVTVINRGKIFEFSLVAPEEVNLSKGKISPASPIGKSLLGKKMGDKIEVRTPQGKEIYKIVKVE